MCVRLHHTRRGGGARRFVPDARVAGGARREGAFGFHARADGTARWFVAPDEPSRDLWVDALSLASDIARRGKSGALERELLGV